MPLFVLIAHDGPEGAKCRDQHRDAHVAHIRTLDQAGRILMAGPIRNDSNDASIGAVIVFEDVSLEQARATAARDPFVAGGVFRSVTVAPFKAAFPERPATT